MALDVEKAGTKNGSNVWQYIENGSIAQQWVLEDAGNGYYYIISKCNGLYLDVTKGNNKNGTNIQMYQKNNSNSQKFRLTKVPNIECEKIVEEGIYNIATASSSSKVVQINEGKVDDLANVEISTYTDAENQKFELKYNEVLKTYTISIPYSNKELDVAKAGLTNKTNVDQFSSNKTYAQQWILEDAGDGYYYIISKCNGLCLDINKGSIANGSNIQVYEKNYSKAQKFKFIKTTIIESTKTVEDGEYFIHTKINSDKLLKVNKDTNKLFVSNVSNLINMGKRFEIKYLESGYYTIMNSGTNKYLSVQSGKKINGTSILQANAHTSTKQEWIIKKIEDDYYVFISRCNGLCIDIPKANVEVGKVLHMYDINNTDAQQFILEKTTAIEADKIIEDGVYKISSALNNNKALDISGGSYNNSANLQIWDKSKVQQQKFQIKYDEENKYYEITPVHSGKVLDVEKAGTNNKTNVQQFTRNNSKAQQWILQNAGNGYYYIVSKCSMLYLDVAGSNTKNGTNIHIYEGNGTNAQKFKLERVTMIDNDLYNITIKNDINKCLDISAGSEADNANLQIWKKNNVNQQVFRVEYVDYIYCKIIARHSNKVLTQQDENVVQSEYQNLDNQLWSIEIGKNGYYKIKSKLTEKYLDVYGNGIANGTNVQVFKKNETNAQLFKFEYLTKKKGIDVSEFNGIINWKNVRKSGKVDFAIIRAGYRGYRTGKLVTDIHFLKNVVGAEANGIDIGIYFFTQAKNVTEAKEEAKYVLNLIKTYNIKVKYPIAIDTEYSGADKNDGRADNLSKETRTAVCKAFVETIQNAGYTAAIYASRDWFYNKLNVSKLTKGDIWVAHYTSAGKTDYKYRYNIWQYSSSGSISGISGKVDLNISYKNY